MDNTEQYMRMRLAAIPDMGMGIPPECPCYTIEGDIWVDIKGDWYYSTEDTHVQLERQDQLQAMVCDKFRLQMPGFIINDLQSWCNQNMLSAYRSMEQLWLAFVMKEKRNKVWTGSEWIEEDTAQTHQ